MPLDSMSSASLALKPHQVTGAAFLAERGFALLADEAGAGKSPQVVAGADLCGARKVLLACPAAVRPHWENTFLDWQRVDRPVTIVEGNVKQAPGDGVTVVSHAAFADRNSVTRMRDGAPYDLVVVDECFPFNAIIQTDRGYLRIGDIVEN